MEIPAAETCSRCGAAFGCAAAQRGGACWCSGVPVTPERLAELAHAYAGCLCPACLRELARAGA